jgi:hypothetical protein
MGNRCSVLAHPQSASSFFGYYSERFTQPLAICNEKRQTFYHLTLPQGITPQ